MIMKITATQMRGRDLQPGDLFSTEGSIYWDTIDLNLSIGERVYIRTNTPFSHADDSEALIYKITIET